MTTLLHADPKDPAWHQARRTFIGASEAAAVLGLSPWANAVDVWAEKLELVPPKADSLSMALGRELEEFIARQWSERTSRTYWAHGLTERHRDYPHIAASPDRIAGDTPELHAQDAAAAGTFRHRDLLECKYVGPNVVDDWDDGVPVYVEVQAQVQMAVTMAPRVHVCALLAGRSPRFDAWTVERDDGAIATIIERLDSWWTTYVVGRQRPPLDGDQSRVEATLGRLYPPPAESSAVRLPPADAETIAELRRTKALAKSLDEDVARLENELRAALGDATDGFIDDNEPPVVTWRPQQRTSWDTKAVLQHADPKHGRPLTFSIDELETAERVLRALESTSTYRVLRVPSPRKAKP